MQLLDTIDLSTYITQELKLNSLYMAKDGTRKANQAARQKRLEINARDKAAKAAKAKGEGKKTPRQSNSASSSEDDQPHNKRAKN